MRLRDAARYFDRDNVYDAYTNAFLFKSQMLSPAEHVSGDTFKRHTLTTKDGISAPARNAIRISDYVWIVGNNNVDTFNNQVIRRNFTLKKSTGLIKLCTPAQACIGVGGVEMHAYREFYKEVTNTPTEADYTSYWDVYFPQNENIQQGSFFLENGRVFRVRLVYTTAEGFIVGESDQYDTDALQTAVFITTGKADLITDKPSSASISAPVVQTDIYKFYRFATEAEDKQKPGDRSVFVPKSSVTPAIGGKLTMLSKTWQIVAINSEQDAWVLHVRLA